MCNRPLADYHPRTIRPVLLQLDLSYNLPVHLLLLSSEPDLHTFLTFQVPNLTSILYFLGYYKESTSEAP